MTICIVSLVNAALAQAGRGDASNPELDPHAAVELGFPNIPSIVIDRFEDGVMISSNLSDHPDRLQSKSGSAIVEIMAAKANWSRMQTVSLTERGGDLHLTAEVAEHCLQDGKGFSVALDGFYRRVCALCGVAPE